MGTIIAELLLGMTILTTLAPILIQKYLDYLSAIGINTNQYYITLFEEVPSTIEAILSLPAQLIVVFTSNIYNLIPNISVVTLIIAVLIAIISFKVYKLFREGK